MAYNDEIVKPAIKTKQKNKQTKDICIKKPTNILTTNNYTKKYLKTKHQTVIKT